MSSLLELEVVMDEWDHDSEELMSVIPLIPHDIHLELA